MKARIRRSRIVRRFALFAAMTVLSSTLATPGCAIAAPLHTMAAALGHAVHGAGRPGFPPLAGRSFATAPHAARLAEATPQPASTVPVVLAMAAVLGVGALVALALGSWMLDFIGRSSRTRGQPRLGVLAL